MIDRDYMRTDPRAYGPPRALTCIVVLTVACFFIEGVVLGRVSAGALHFFALTPEHVFRRGFVWELLTHVLLHQPFHYGHILFNMLALWWFGDEIERIFGSKRFAALYVGGAVASGLLYAGLGMLSDPARPAIGASGAVMTVLVLAAIYTPGRQVLLFWFIPVPIRWLVAFYILVDAYTLASGMETGTAIAAHLGGALFGYLFHLWSTRETKAARRDAGSRVSPTDARADARVDAVLEKISREGMGSLTLEERKILEEASRRKQSRS